ncbi:MAG: VWA domain-containing protein [Verrucomicrobiota bacterium]
MQFAHPKMLWLLAFALPMLTAFLWWSWRKKQFLTSQFVRSRLLAHLTVGLSKTVQKLRMASLALAAGLLVLTLAQPRWGFAWEEAHQRGLDIVVAIDTSRSMLAEDIVPNRLQRAKLAALDLTRLAHRDRLGLVAFAGTAFLQCPLTVDDEAFRQSVAQLDVGIIPQGGSALAEAIRSAARAFKEEGDNHRVLVLLTDGEDHEQGALEAAETAAADGLKIFTIGIGTPNGELLRQRDEHGNLNYVKDEEGNVVKSRLNETLLTQIATAAEGFYLPMSGANTMDVLYQRGLAPLPRGDSTATRLIKQYQERFQWPLLLGILLLLIEIFLPERRRVQRTEAMALASNPELRKIVAGLVLALAAEPALASTSSALRKYEAGQYKDAYHEYARLLERRPDDPRLHYNAGTAAYQAKKYDEAVRHFSAAATAQDLQLQEHAYYNLGNSLYRVGDGEPDLAKKKEAWEHSTKQYQAALNLDAKDADAKFNLDFVKKRLEELNQQQQKSDSKDKQKKDQDKKDDQDQKDQDKQQPQDKNSQDKQEQKPPQDKNQSKDKESKDKNKDKDNKQQEQKQPEPKQDQAAPKPDKNKPDKDQANGQDTQPQPEPKQDPAQTNATDAATAALAGQMTPDQAKQLLDSQKDNEKAMIFLPPDKAQNRKRVFRDW